MNVLTEIRESAPSDTARREEKSILLETEGYALLRELGITVPRTLLVRNSAEAERANLSVFSGTRVVVKVASPNILHKTDVGGVRIVARDRSYVLGAIQDMERRFAQANLEGFLICEFVEHDTSLGCELLLSMRWTADFGPLVFLGIGGTASEYLAANMRPGKAMAILTPAFHSEEEVKSALCEKTVVPLITGNVRGGRVRMTGPDLVAFLRRVLAFASRNMPERIREMEINPLVLTERGPVALDVLCRPGSALGTPYPDRPVSKIKNLLLPGSIAIAGVSEKMNPGRIILRNILGSGFPPGKICVIKQGLEEIDGCKCVPDIGSMDGTADLLILSVDAHQIPDLTGRVIEGKKAESMILISGGLGERQGTAGLESQVRCKLAESRSSADGGPILNGGNCLGVRSVPGKYDTLFIPGYKLRFPDSEPAPLAVISQSGAYLVAAASKLSAVNPRYLISVGNQTDLTAGDYLASLKDDPSIKVFACYVEGFRPMDGLKWIQAAHEITRSGRKVLLYRAGRTTEGAKASASHTASIAGEYAVTCEMARQAGAIVADTLPDFTDLMRLFCLLEGKQVGGWKIAALSNAGFECVAMADRLGKFRLAEISPFTQDHLRELLRKSRLDGVVDVRNPLDVTPILDDAGYEAAIRALMEDQNVDVGIIGCVPITGRLNTLATAEMHSENVLSPESVASKMIRLFHELPKAWIVVVDGGSLYDPMVALLERYGVPVFRSADRALALFETYCASRL